MWEEMWLYLQSWFNYPNSQWDTVLIGIGLALGFTAFWLAGHWSSLFKNRWLWGVAVFSALFTVLAIVFVQIPLQIWADEASRHFWDAGTMLDWWLLISIPQLLVRGLVQEGAKMVPMAFWWWRNDRVITPKAGLMIGAVVGAGFGLFEALHVHLQVFSAGWTWEVYQTEGFTGIAVFWDAFFNVGFSTAISALIGYGLAKGKGWQFYLIGAGVHLLYNYRRVLLQMGHISALWGEIYAGLFTIVITAIVIIWLSRMSAGAEVKAEEEIVGDKPDEITD